MKRLIMMLIFLFLAYFCFQIGYRYIGPGHTANYKIKNKENSFNIEETYKKKTDNDILNYYFKISINDKEFTFQTHRNYNHSERIIKKIQYFKDNNYECILPQFINDDYLSDVMCYSNNVIEYYHNLVGKDAELDTFISKIPNYDYKKWQDNKNNPITEYPLTLYSDNIVDNHFIGIDNYSGIYTINNVNLKKYQNIRIFDEDVYSRPISATVNHYYVVADYSKSFEFGSFIIVNLHDNKKVTINSDKRMSFESYIQGSVGNSFYVFDPKTKIQYEVDIKSKNIIEVGNQDLKIKYYENGKWTLKEAYEASQNKLYFVDSKNNNDYQDQNYLRIDKVGNKSGYYYLYKKVNDYYQVYRMNIQDKKGLTHIFDTKNPEHIQYQNEYIYFMEGSEIKYYSDLTGVKTLANNEEFKFNKNLFFTVNAK